VILPRLVFPSQRANLYTDLPSVLVSGQTEAEAVRALVEADVHEIAVILCILPLDLGYRVAVLKERQSYDIFGINTKIW